MKQIRLMLHRMQLQQRSQRLFTILLVLAQVFAVFIVLFGSAAIQSTLVKQKVLDEHQRNFTINFLFYSDTETEQELIGYQEVDGVQQPVYEESPKVDYSHTVSLNELQQAVQAIADSSIMGYPERVWVKGEWNGHSYGFPLLQPAGTQDMPEVILDPYVFPDYKVGDTITYAGITCRVSAISDMKTSNITTEDIRAIPEDVRCYRVEFDYADFPTTAQAEQMQNLLKEQFPGYTELYMPETLDPLTAQFQFTTLAMTVLMLLAVLLNLCYAQMYQFRLRQHTFSVYRMCGARQSDVLGICLFESLLIAALCYVGTALAFHFCLRNTVAEWYEGADSLYTLRFYVLLGLAYLGFLLFMLLPPLFRFLRREVMTSEREATL